ncbi:hypothetical protein KUCAC02_037344, partial [Chaenocephalus aceratus]
VRIIGFAKWDVFSLHGMSYMNVLYLVSSKHENVALSSWWSSLFQELQEQDGAKTSERHVKKAELLSIKRELTAIKVQIDGLLDCVDKMDAQRTDCSGRSVILQIVPEKEMEAGIGYSQKSCRQDHELYRRDSPPPTSVSYLPITLSLISLLRHRLQFWYPIHNDDKTCSWYITRMSESSPLTSHVLNTADGVPAARLPLSLHRLDPRTMTWTLLSVGTTDEDGRCAGLIGRDAFGPGMYKVRFETGSYWESLGQSSFFPYVEVRSSVSSSGASLNQDICCCRTKLIDSD